LGQAAFEDLVYVATLYDVARLAGVSTATVSRVVHGQDRVRESTRARVQKAIDELGYVPDSAAQSLSRRRKDVIGLICIERPRKSSELEDGSMLYYDKIMRGVEARIRDSNLSLLITFQLGNIPPDVRRLELLSGKVDGILLGEDIFPPHTLEPLARRIPLAVIAGPPTGNSVDTVTSDNRSGSAALTSHLVDAHGYRRLHIVDGPGNSPDAYERRLGVEQVLRSHPGCTLVGSYRGSYSAESGAAAAEQLLARRGEELPEAIIAMNDPMAIGVLGTLSKAGVKVPHDVAVVGFDDIFPSSLTDPPLTTVSQPMRMLGERACSRLIDRIADPGLPPKVEVLPTELVIRESCGCSPGTSIRQAVPEMAWGDFPAGGSGPSQRARRED
jgi:LacI family transcriptional regulator